MEVFIAVLEDDSIWIDIIVFEKQHDAMVQIGKWQKAEEDHRGEVSGWSTDKYEPSKTGLLYMVSVEGAGPTMTLWKKEVQ